MDTELTRVLVVGLRPDHEEIVRASLEAADGYAIRTADSIVDAAAGSAPPFDVALVPFPSESAEADLRETLEAARDVPVMAVAADGDERGAEAVRQGCADYLRVETATPVEIRRAVDHVVEVGRLKRDRARLEEQLEQTKRGAFTDPDTGLPNRPLFMDRLERAAARRRRGERRDLAVLYLDVDRFEMVNEGLGHRAGDELLKRLAVRLKGQLRAEDSIARMGGDEFAILLDGIDELTAPTFVAERIMTALEEPFEVAGTEVFVSVGIGIAITGSVADPEALLREADTAMHKAKEQGPGSFRLFDEGMHESAVALFELETDLRGALERDEFVIHYQPVVDLAEDRLAGFEALVRWQHRERGMIPPDAFLWAAEDTGLIVELGAHVLRGAMEQLRAWHELGPQYHDIFMSVNLSPRQFADPLLVETIAETLEETGVPGHLLRLELTESVVIEDPDAVARSLHEIQGLGVTLCIDDFGTGYSALNYLHNFPIDVIKIDRSFISRIREDVEGDVVEAIIALARNLGMAAVAEGVETEIQLNRLRKLGSTAVQGFLFSTPLDADAAERYLHARND